MKRRSNLKQDIDKIKQLKALQQKATDKLDKITVKAGGKPAPVKKPGPAAPKKSKRKAKKPSFWQKLFGAGNRTSGRKI